jgi:lysophospholipase L1-like esterase
MQTLRLFAILTDDTMTRFIFKTLKVSVLTALVVSLVITLGIGALTLYSPKTVITFIERLSTPEPLDPIQIQGVAVLGDSQSDEYRADDKRGENYSSTTLNWVEILDKNRNIPFGAWSTYNDSRRTGYAYNWAQSGATTTSMIASGQHIGVAQQVKKGEVNVVIIYIGANDFAPFVTADGYEAIYNGQLTEADLIAKRNGIVANIKTAIDVIQNSGDAKIALVQIPNWGNNFGVSLAFPNPEQRARVNQELAATNAELSALAALYMIPTLDPNIWYQENIRENGGKVAIGDTRLERLLITNDPRNMFLDDGVHPGTAMNALFANEIIKTLNINFGTGINQLSDEEILKISGIK